MRKLNCVLAQYFKVKTVSAFIRQLNRYGFERINKRQGYFEFKHDQFKKGNLKQIKKSCYRRILFKEELKRNREELNKMTEEHEKLHNQFNDTKTTLEDMKKQNTKLVDINKGLVVNLYFFKQEYEIRLKQILFCFYMSLNHNDDNVTKEVKTMLEGSGIDKIPDSSKINCFTACMKTKEFVKLLIKHFLFCEEQNAKLLEEVTKIYLNHLRNNLGVESIEIDWKQLASEVFQKGSTEALLLPEILHDEHKDDKIDQIIPKEVKDNANELNIFSDDKRRNSTMSKTECMNDLDFLSKINSQMQKSRSERMSENSFSMNSVSMPFLHEDSDDDKDMSL